MSVPDWVQDAVFYQIFPDRFANGDPENDPPNLMNWGSTPTSWGFQGGDISGILQKFDYLLDLGINAIYLNPIFQASSNHRYNTTDYYHIDPKLGTLDDFRKLIEHAHRNEVRIILDGVFNHCGRGFFAFNDVLENQEYSPYREWFHIKHFPVDAYSWGGAVDYLGWWGMKSLPKFNIDNPKTRRYLMGVARYWIDQGADGWRLDVPNEINDDNFWAEFRQVVKSANSEAYLVGEIWSADRRWVGDEHFDGLMNYPIMEALAGFLATNTLDAAHFAEKVEGLLSLYPHENAYAMYIPLDSHDTERILTRMGNNIYKTQLAYLFQFAYPGSPAIYYGDEIGLVGGKDPACRGAFLWEESTWNTELRDFIKTLVRFRKNHVALRRGEYIRLDPNTNPACYAFARTAVNDEVLVIMNANAKEQKTIINIDKIGWKEGQVISDLLSPEQQYEIENHAIEIVLPAWSGVWLG
jgi:cyclomaltodextrinase / maltogenic alpha-amylase / neopullulanase